MEFEIIILIEILRNDLLLISNINSRENISFRKKYKIIICDKKLFLINLHYLKLISNKKRKANNNFCCNKYYLSILYIYG